MRMLERKEEDVHQQIFEILDCYSFLFRTHIYHITDGYHKKRREQIEAPSLRKHRLFAQQSRMIFASY